MQDDGQDNKRLRPFSTLSFATNNSPYVPLRTLSDDQLQRIRLNHEKALARLAAKGHISPPTTALPSEVWYYILSLLPVPDFIVCKFTCKQFKSVVDSEQFAFWKRQRYTTVRKPMSYISYLLCTPEELQEYSVPEIFVAHHNLNKFDDIITLFTSPLYSTAKILRVNPKYIHYGHEALTIFGHIKGIEPILEVASHIIRSERLESVRSRIGLWAVTAVIVLLSIGWYRVVDIAEAIIQYSSVGRPDVTEFLHLMWCILGGTRQWIKQRYISPTLVFDIGCALNYLESSVFAGKTWAEKQGGNIYAVTQEQRVIIECDLAPGEVLMVTAFAGAGKTTSLVEYARRRPGKRFLYIAYSKSLEQEAPKTFQRGGCRNVTARTIHSIAYQYYASTYGHKIREDKTHELASALSTALKIQTYTARYVIKTLSNFQASKSPNVLRDHIPFAAKLYHEDLRKQGKEKENYTNLDEFYIQLTERAWTLMQDITNASVCMTHDGYLKMYQLNIHTIPRLGYDIILLDEAQDINPVISDILVAEVSCAGLIMVGDPHQQIFAFRGAVDAMKRWVGNTRRLNLSQSFRFGAEIATLANVVLQTMKRERKAIFGMGIPGVVYTRAEDAPEKRTIICRSNFGLFSTASGMRGKKKIYLWGNTKLDLSLYQDILHLWEGDLSRISHSKIKKFKSMDELGHHASVVHDRQIQLLIEYFRTFQGREYEFQQNIDAIRQCIVKTQEEADVILTNVHQAKGMEWDCVELAEDYASCFIDTSRGHSLTTYCTDKMSKGKIQKSREEINILYVALTRARKSLVLNTTLLELLSFCTGEKAIPRPVHTTIGARKCAACDQGEMASQFTMQLYPYSDYCYFLRSPPMIRNEELCPKCVGTVPHVCPDIVSLIK